MRSICMAKLGWEAVVLEHLFLPILAARPYKRAFTTRLVYFTPTSSPHLALRFSFVVTSFSLPQIKARTLLPSLGPP